MKNSGHHKNQNNISCKCLPQYMYSCSSHSLFRTGRNWDNRRQGKQWYLLSLLKYKIKFRKNQKKIIKITFTMGPVVICVYALDGTRSLDSRNSYGTGSLDIGTKLVVFIWEWGYNNFCVVCSNRLNS